MLARSVASRALPTALLAAAISANASAQWATVEVIPSAPAAPDQSLFPYSITPDGSTLVGFATVENFQIEAFRWTRSGGLQLLGDLAGGNIQSRAWAVSDDGSIVVGQGWNGTVSRAFRWTQATGMIELPLVPGQGAGASSFAYSITADGAMAVGMCGVLGIGSNTTEARWTQAGAAGTIRYEGQGISADGAIMAGVGSTGGHSQSWVWTVGSPSATFLPLVPSAVSSFAWTISRDGSTVIGNTQIPRGTTGINDDWGFRWTAASGSHRIELPPAATGNATYPTGVSADGSIIVGTETGVPGPVHSHAIVWDAQNGTRDLNDILHAQYGIDLGPWVLNWATTISADGSWIAANGYNISGNNTSVSFLIHFHTGCYANCDQSTALPILNVNDFVCFQSLFAAGDPAANCDNSTAPPAINVNDFICFMSRFAQACS